MWSLPGCWFGCEPLYIFVFLCPRLCFSLYMILISCLNSFCWLLGSLECFFVQLKLPLLYLDNHNILGLAWNIVINSCWKRTQLDSWFIKLLLQSEWELLLASRRILTLIIFWPSPQAELTCFHLNDHVSICNSQNFDIILYPYYPSMSLTFKFANYRIIFTFTN